MQNHIIRPRLLRRELPSRHLLLTRRPCHVAVDGDLRQHVEGVSMSLELRGLPDALRQHVLPGLGPGVDQTRIEAVLVACGQFAEAGRLESGHHIEREQISHQAAPFAVR